MSDSLISSWNESAAIVMGPNPRKLDRNSLRLYSSTDIKAVEAQTNAQQAAEAEYYPPAKVRDRRLRNWLLLANALFWLIVIIVIRIAN